MDDRFFKELPTVDELASRIALSPTESLFDCPTLNEIWLDIERSLITRTKRQGGVKSLGNWGSA